MPCYVKLKKRIPKILPPPLKLYDSMAPSLVRRYRNQRLNDRVGDVTFHNKAILEIRMESAGTDQREERPLWPGEGS